MSLLRNLTLLLPVVLLAGCQSGPLSSWFFAQQDRTTYQTPRMRMDEALAMGDQANGEDTPDQQQLVVDLARKIQTEPDPLVRESIVKAVAGFRTPLASQVLTAGLQDSAPLVRRRCCTVIGERGDATLATALAETAQNDSDLDVRIEAVRALGGMPSPETNTALIAAMEANDPAIQFAAVQSMKQTTGKDFGGDVRAYLAYAKGENSADTQDEQTSVASRLGRFLPF